MQNLFDILGLDTGFRLNLKTLEGAYFAAQRATHPDRFIGRPEAERAASIGKSQLVNDAYETLKNPLMRAVHLLELQGVRVLASDTKVPSGILAETMELREHIFDSSEDAAALSSLSDEIRLLADSTNKALDEAFAAVDYTQAAEQIIRLQYLGKAMEEVHMRIYRLKAVHG